jgi:L-lactate dehydrogenase complex protein LldE
MRIALFITCFNDALFPRTGVSMVRILEKLGHDLTFPPDQTCCGQIHFNTGYRKDALGLLKRFLGIFEGAEVVVAPSASCVAMVREQYPVLASETGDADLEGRVRSLAQRVFELSEFLVGELGIEDVGACFRNRVALHPTCHSTRSIDVGDAPVRLLRAVEGLELVDLPDAGDCCGFGGTFSVKNPETSLAMMGDKIEGVLDSGAETLTAVDNSCLMHLAGGLRRRGMLSEPGEDPVAGARIRILHLAEILGTFRGEGE